MEKARIFAVKIEATKSKKSVRFVDEVSAPSIIHGSTSNFDLTPLVNQMKAIELKVDKAIRDKSLVRTQSLSPSSG